MNKYLDIQKVMEHEHDWKYYICEGKKVRYCYGCRTEEKTKMAKKELQYHIEETNKLLEQGRFTIQDVGEKLSFLTSDLWLIRLKSIMEIENGMIDRLKEAIKWWTENLSDLSKEYFTKAKLMAKEERMENLELQIQAKVAIGALEVILNGPS